MKKMIPLAMLVVAFAAVSCGKKEEPTPPAAGGTPKVEDASKPK